MTFLPVSDKLVFNVIVMMSALAWLTCNHYYSFLDSDICKELLFDQNHGQKPESGVCSGALMLEL
jgi:hypothetical protein